MVRQLQGEEQRWRIRIGNYRMVHRIEGEDVTVVRVAHRSEVYEGI